ncbi:MAG: hypothetical protein ACLQLC_19500 [Candidatus Sulfotelmatobacter sp.]
MFLWKGTEFADVIFVSRVRTLIMRGHKAKDAVEMVIREIAEETGGDPEVAQKARQAGEEFMGSVKIGLI